MLAMLKKGLIFGAGFALSFLVIFYIGATIILQPYLSSPEGTPILTIKGNTTGNSNNENIQVDQFREIEIDEKIKLSSVIAIARYQTSPDGKKRAIISEILKKEPNTTFYYKIGDEYESSSYYPRDNKNYGDGVVIFFTGSPARMRMSMSYHGDRIHGLGDLPIELLRKKCEKNA